MTETTATTETIEKLKTEPIEELEKKRSELSNKLAILQNKIVGLNREASRFARKRDDITMEVRELVDSANKCRSLRDEFNAKVKEYKTLRDEFNEKVRKDREAFDALKREKLPKDGVTIGKLKRDFKSLEFEQMTKVHSAAKEKGLIEAMGKIEKQIKQREQIFENDAEIKNLLTEIKESEKKADEAHGNIEKLVDEAQKQHDEMISLFEEADALRKKADEEHAKFVEKKVEANKYEAEFKEILEKVRAYEKAIAEIRKKQKEEEREKAKGEVEKKADDLFRRFMSGEKLSTEDLMMLQKAGFL